MEAKKNLFAELSPEERASALREIAFGTSNEKVRRNFSTEQKQSQKDFVTAEGIKLMDLKKEFSDISKEFRANIKDYEDQIKETLTSAKIGYSEKEEVVYLIDDQDSGMMDIYDSEGNFVYSRKLHPEERQAKTVSMNRTGTNG